MSSKRPAIDPSILLKAAKRVLIEKESKKSVSRDLNIPRTNLRRYIAKIGSEIPDITTATDDDLLDVLDTTRTRIFLKFGSCYRPKQRWFQLYTAFNMEYG